MGLQENTYKVPDGDGDLPLVTAGNTYESWVSNVEWTAPEFAEQVKTYNAVHWAHQHAALWRGRERELVEPVGGPWDGVEDPVVWLARRWGPAREALRAERAEVRELSGAEWGTALAPMKSNWYAPGFGWQWDKGKFTDVDPA